MTILKLRLFQILFLPVLVTLMISCQNNTTSTDNVSSVQGTKRIVVENNILRIETEATDREKYQSITIGNQEWMKEDLKVEIFVNGDSIFHASSDKEWESALKNKKPAWCYVLNRKDKFYNIYALTDERKIVPEGWRIPSCSDWQILSNYINKSQDSIPDNIPRKWVQIPKSINTHGFNNKNNGFRYESGEFFNINKNSFYWAADNCIATNAFGEGFVYKYGSVLRVKAYFGYGFQIRCIKK
jgi:uncharacterized protein (TIGR02145 family)